MRDTGLQLVDERVDSWNWRNFAACRDEDPELFFPLGQGAAFAPQIAEAKAVCARCTVRAWCLQDALDRGIDEGVLGGLDENERRKLRARQVDRRAAQRQRARRRAWMETRAVVGSRGADADFEALLAGRVVVLPRGTKGDFARRLFAAGKSKGHIMRALRLSGTTVNKMLEGLERGRAAS